jgi:hypothetical protein
VGGSNPAKTKGLKILSLSRKDKQQEGMPIKGTEDRTQKGGRRKGEWAVERNRGDNKRERKTI